MEAKHISTPSYYPDHLSGAWAKYNENSINVGVEEDGICHCDPQPESSVIGECPTCHRLDLRKSFAGKTSPIMREPTKGS